MDEFQSEKEQIEEVKKWWKDNGSFIVTGLILGLGVLGGWKYWQDYKLNRASAASAHYEELGLAIARGDGNGASDLLARLSDEFKATPYASQGRLAMAKFHVQSNELELAAEQLRAVVDTSKDDNLKLIARLRLARVLMAQEKHDNALDTLSVARTGEFAARFHDVRGDVYAMLGRDAEARAEYQSALDLFEPGLIDRNLVEMKLNDLGGADNAAVIEPEPEPEA